MSNKKLTYDRLVKLGAHKPELRPHIRPILRTLKRADEDNPCWDGYEMVGMKEDENGNMVPNCVPKKDSNVGKRARNRWMDMDGRTFDVGSVVEFWRDGGRVWKGTVMGFERDEALVGDPNSSSRPIKIDVREAREHLRVVTGSGRPKKDIWAVMIPMTLSRKLDELDDASTNLESAFRDIQRGVARLQGKQREDIMDILEVQFRALMQDAQAYMKWVKANR